MLHPFNVTLHQNNLDALHKCLPGLMRTFFFVFGYLGLIELLDQCGRHLEAAFDYIAELFVTNKVFLGDLVRFVMRKTVALTSALLWRAPV